MVTRLRKRYLGENYGLQDLLHDLLAGVIVGLVSIPISMGYAQVAGLPMVYGLYGSLLPILLFAIFTRTHYFAFGVDAAPAALVGGILLSLDIPFASDQAIRLVPVITVMVAVWLLLFYLLKAGRIVKYISLPVMGGFVSGICCTIILMQIPKLYGGNVGRGEASELLEHIISTIVHANPASLILGLLTIVLIRVTRRLIPKFPTPVFVMLVGVLLTKYGKIARYGIKVLPWVRNGLPKLVNPGLGETELPQFLFATLSIAIVIMSETLLASKNEELKNGTRLRDNPEIFAYSMANFASFVVGSLPVNGSLSRTGLARQYGAKSHLMSVVASLVMLIVLLKFTWVVGYMPVCMLTAIVICALMNACEFGIAVKLFKSNREEFYIFVAAFLSVLIFGTIYGVAVGVFLSFVAVAINATAPPRIFKGLIPGDEDFHDLKRHDDAVPIKHTILYRFGGNLFFANIDDFQDDIENAIQEDTKQIIVNVSGVSNLDITAAERLLLMYRRMKQQDIKLFLIGYMDNFPEHLRAYGAGELVEDGCLKKTAERALAACGLKPPYPT